MLRSRIVSSSKTSSSVPECFNSIKDVKDSDWCFLNFKVANLTLQKHLTLLNFIVPQITQASNDKE